MTYLEAYKICVNQFLDNWNHTAIEQEGVKIQSNDLDEFVRIQVFNDDSSNYSHGSPPARLLIGHVMVEIYTRRGRGVGRLLELTDACSAIFSNQKLANGLKLDSAEIIDRQEMISGETVTDPNWISKAVLTKFRAPL